MAQLKVGDVAPDFSLPDQDGSVVRLADLAGQRVVLFFYPKDDTPGCTRQACGFRDAWEDVQAAGATVLGISRDGEASHRHFRDKFALPYPLLVDANHEVIEAYGAWGEKTNYGKTSLGILRGHVVIGPDGRVEDVQIKVNPEESVERALAVVRR